MNYAIILKREIWEHRSAFLTTPSVLGISILVLLVMGLILLFSGVIPYDGSRIALNAGVAELTRLTDTELSTGWQAGFTALTAIFNSILFIVVFFYLLGSLADDRKDKSILFWRSMPVTDTVTVLSKYATAAFVAPILMVAALAATQMGLMIIATILIWLGSGSAWALVWSNANPWIIWLNLVGAYLVQAIWMAPLFGWLLLASAYSKRRPFLTAIVPIVVLSLLENWVSLLKSLNLSETFFTPFIFERLTHGPIPMSVNFKQNNDTFSMFTGDGHSLITSSTSYLSLLSEPEMWIGLIIGAVFISGAIFLRRYRDDA